MRSNRPLKIGGGLAAVATCSGALDSRTNRESIEVAQCDKIRRVFAGARAEASNTTPEQKHDRPSSRGARGSGAGSPSGGRVARHRSQQALAVTLVTPARPAAARAAQLYGQSSTAAIAMRMGKERMELPDAEGQILLLTLRCSGLTYNPNVIRDYFHTHCHRRT